ncbi:MAG: trypsin-like serine protease, partial [Proteobacteria bacterium]
VRRIARFVVHPNFRAVDGLSDDLAIAILDRAVPEGSLVAALPGEELQIAFGEKVKALGYGIQNINGEPRPPVPEAGAGWEPIRLDSKEFIVADSGVEELGGVKTNYHRVFVNQPEGGLCGGDSGGPVYLLRGNDSPLLMGVNGAVAPPVVPKERWPICAETAFINRADTSLGWIRTVLEENR